MKRILLSLIIMITCISLSAQVYDGITQPTVFRYWMPVNVPMDGTGQLSAAPYVGVKIDAIDWLSFTPVLQYNITNESPSIQLWTNFNHKKTLFFLHRLIYDVNGNRLDQTLSGTAKLKHGFHADFTWFNFSNG